MIEYRIYKSVYDDMVSGNKNVEIRLVNDKSRGIKIGDKIRFKVVDSNTYLIVEVTNIYNYKDIDELWNDKDIVLKSASKYSKDKFIELIYNIIGKENVLNSEIIGIEFKVLNNNY